MTHVRHFKAAAMLGLLSFLCSGSVEAVEIALLSPETWDEFAPSGKEMDAIYGDIVLRNERLTLVIAAPKSARNANMTVRDVGGALIDFTTRKGPNDQLSAFYPGGGQFKFHDASQIKVVVDGAEVSWGGRALEGETVELHIAATGGPCESTLTYRLGARDDFAELETTFKNDSSEAVSLPLRDSLRADRTFEFGADEATHLFWAVDEWFGQAYGVQSLDHEVSFSGNRGVVVRYRAAPLPLAAGESYRLTRRLFVGSHGLAVRGRGHAAAGRPAGQVRLDVSDPAGAVAHALVKAAPADDDGAVFATARTSDQGDAEFKLPAGDWALVVEAQGRDAERVELVVKPEAKAAVAVKLAACGYVAASVTDVDGRGIPCKAAFHGLNGAVAPDWGPDSAADGVKNLRYTASGTFRCEIAPGEYEVLISRGPEHDLLTRRIRVKRGETTRVNATLKRTVKTPGWISADFHSHASPSGDNTASQRGRVQNLLAEHIEFGPCTEHNRISTYGPHLKSLGAERWMATCPGMELTGSPLVINHQNAFPLRRTPRTQDGGGPTTDVNPVIQIERLAMWDEGSEKLVQVNHPHLAQIVGDKDLDGKYDGGFEGMLGFMDVVEVHPLEGIFTPPASDRGGRPERNPIYRWMQMLNLGYRVPGVINTDAHYNYHESGWRRNYLASPVDDPAKIKVSDMVEAAEAGRMIMTNGPFLELVLKAGGEEAGPGESLAARGAEPTLEVRVQCANWLDVNRVQVFVNGRPDKRLNFTRRSHPQLFGNGVVKFDHRIGLSLAEDAHVIVAAAGEGLELGRTMGPRYGKRMPMAVSNPVFVDIDGQGFRPNGDLLGVPLPHGKKGVGK